MLLALVFLASPGLFAQTAGYGAISGTVLDSSHAAIPNVKIKIINTDTGAEREVTTTDAGAYVAQFLKPGHYEVTATAPGFAVFDRKNLDLLVGQTLGVDIDLPLQSVQSSVTVTLAPPVIDTEKVQTSQELGQTLIGNLPVNGRRYDNFVLLTPNVVPDGNTGLISYRGISGLYNSNLVDGANNNQAFFSEARGRSIGAPYVYSQDSIQEFQSATSGYSAEFGQAAGGQINAITRSGSNLMHGDLFYYLRYPDLNALDPQGKRGKVYTQPVHQQHQFGGSVGGPIQKDKLFYFFTYDGFRKVNPILYLYPTGITADTINKYGCPAGVSADQCTKAKNYLNSLPGAFARTIKQDIFFPRLDYQLNEKNHINASFNWQNFNEPNGYNTSSSTNISSSSVSSNGTANFHERIFVANWNSVLSSRSVNELRFQWARDLETADANAPGPNVSISGLANYGAPTALPRGAFPDEHRWQVADIYSTTHGRHSIKAGVDLNFIHEYLSNLFQGNGNYSYSMGSGATALETRFQAWVQDVYGLNGGKHYTNFVQVNDPITHAGIDDFWNKDLAGFVEDRWKLTPDFLISGGIRYDVQLVPQPPNPYPATGNVLPSVLGNYYTNKINISYYQFQPRVGFSWQAQPGTVVRGGYGMFTGLTSNSTYYTMRVENGVYQQQYTVLPTDSYAVTAPNVLFTPPGPALTAPFAGAVTPQAINTTSVNNLAPLSFRGLDPNFKNPYTHSVDLAIEQQIPGKMSLSVGYVGTRGMRLPMFIDANLKPATKTKTYDVVASSGNTSSSVTVPYYTARLDSNVRSLLVGYSDINSWYHSMAVTIKRPMDHGLQVLINYTWSKAMDGSQVSGVNGTFNGTNSPLDPFNRKAEYARSDMDMRNRFVGTIVYAPTFSSSSKAIRYVANGWSLSGTATEQTGLPVTANMSGYPTSKVLLDDGTVLASNVGNGGVTGAMVSLYNSATAGRAPQVKRNAFPGPGLRNVDARLSRDFSLTEKIHMQMFAEAFNLFNQQNRTSVNTTAYQYSALTVPDPTSTDASKRTPACSTLSHTRDCITPYTATPFGSTSSTSSILYGPRQLQFSTKLIF